MSRWYWKKVAPDHFVAVAKCERCGVEFNSGNIAASKYCPECSRTVKAIQNRNRVKRYRERHKHE